MIGHYWFMLFFILIPNIAIGIVFIKFKYDNIAQEDLYLVKARVGRPVEFSEENILNVRKVNCQQMEEGKATELNDSKSDPEDLHAKLESNPDGI